MRDVKALLKQIGRRTCFWVGPPTYKKGPVFDSCGEKYNVFVSQMEKVIRARHCWFIDSRKIVDPQTGMPIEANYDDQIHFDPRLGQIWSDKVAEEIALLSLVSR